MWKITYDKPAGERCNKLGLWIQVYGDVCWWNYDQRKWLPDPSGACSNAKGCKTLKAFKRHLRKHPELKGQEVILCSRYVGYDITANWE